MDPHAAVLGDRPTTWWETLWPAAENDPDQQSRMKEWKQTWGMMGNLVHDGFLFDPIALEVVVNVKDENRKVVQVVEVQPGSTIISAVSFLFVWPWMQINACTSVCWACSVASLPHVPVVEPGLMFEVKLFQILQRNPLLLLPAPVEQTLHTALKNAQWRWARRHRRNTFFL